MNEEPSNDEARYGHLFKSCPDYLRDHDMEVQLDAWYGFPRFPLSLGVFTHLGQAIRTNERHAKFHITGVDVYQGDSVLTVMKGNATKVCTYERDPSFRGSIVEVNLLSECGHILNVAFRFHKGKTYVSTDYGGNLVPTEVVPDELAKFEFWRE